MPRPWASLLLIAAALPCAASGDARPRRATFDVTHRLDITVPEGAKHLRAWFAMPQPDDAQRVRRFDVDCPYPTRIVTDDHGNSAVFLELHDPKPGPLSIVETFVVTRAEVRSGVDASKSRALTDAERQSMREHLEPDANVVIDDEIRTLSAEIVGDETNPVIAARRIYDWVLGHIDYWVKDPAHAKASPVGSTTYCLANRTGNCTDFHSLWTSLARAAGIPTRMVYGSFLKAELDGKDKDQSYHCWPEFWAPGFGWVPHDVAVADIFVGDFETTTENAEKVRLTTAAGYSGADASKVAYYFGNIDERRVVWSRGRDLSLDPPQAGPPVNALAKAHVEIDGRVAEEKTAWTRKLTFSQRR